MKTTPSRRGYWLCGILALAACSREPKLAPGATEFVTEEPYYGGGQTNVATPDSPAVGGASDKNSGAPSGRTGTVEEADIYRVDSNRLFYFNTYRGFMIYDLNDAKHPQLVSRLPVYGYPVEMYVDGSTVYALIRDALYLTQDAGGQKFERHDNSQLVTIDVSDIQHPQVLQTIDIIGQLREGVSRKIDDTIYVVSYMPQNYYGWWYWDWGWYGPIDTDKEQAWVYSFNIADAKNPALVDKLKIFEGGGSQSSTSGSSMSHVFQSVAISATSNTLHVVENWQNYGYSSGSGGGCGTSYGDQQAIVSVVDISDPSGAIRLHTKFDTSGSMSDQFKQTYVYDPVTQHGYYYGIFGRQAWTSSGCSGASATRNYFEAWDITNGSAPVMVGSLQFGQDNEQVRGSIFDPDRKVAFAITVRQIDPFYAISFADPAHPTIVSEVDGLAGDVDAFRFVGDGNKFVLGIGRDSTDTCTGFATGSNTWHSGVSVSIFDVQDLTKTRLVQRACVDIPDAQWVSSEVNWNLDQANKMIGVGSVGGQNVVSVPVSYYKRTDENSWWWYRYSSAVGMMTWDLSKYDPSKDELHQGVLVNHGSVEHGHGSVRRTIVFNHTGDVGGDRGMLLNLSDTYLSLYDIQNVDAPIAQAEVELAPDVEELYRFGGFVVEHVREEGYSWGIDTASIFRVKPTGGVIDQTAPVASFTVGQVQRVMKWKDALVIFRSKLDPNASAVGNPYQNATSQAIVYDLSNPAAPVLRSVTDLGEAIYPYYNYWCGDFFGPWGWWGGWWWGGNIGNWVAFDGGLAFSTTRYDYNNGNATQTTKLVYLNLTDLSAPQLKTHDLTGTDRDFLALTADASDAGGFFLAFRDRVGVINGPDSNYKLGLYKYYAQRWSTAGDDIHSDAATNTPGQLVRSWKSGDRTLLLTEDNLYNWATYASQPSYGYWNGTPRLHLLERQNDSTAVWRSAHEFAQRYLGALVGDGDRVYVTSSHAYDYSVAISVGPGGVQTPTQTVDTADHLTIFDVAALKLDPSFDSDVGLPRVSAMGAAAGRLYLSVPSSGVLVLDATDAANPRGKSFLRTLGWGSHLEIAGDTIFVAAGNFGVFQRSLGAAALSP